MAITNFLQFNNPAINQETDAQYAADSNRAGGFGTDAIVPSPLLNKILYQSSTFIAAFGMMMAAKGYSTSDADINVLAAVLANVLTEADQLPNIQTVAYSPTPSFNAAAANGFRMSLVGNVTSSTLSGVTPGQLVAFYFIQDAVGGRTVSWPAGITGTVQPDPTANSISLILYRADTSGTLRGAGPLVSNNGVFFGGTTNGTGNATFGGSVSAGTGVFAGGNISTAATVSAGTLSVSGNAGVGGSVTAGSASISGQATVGSLTLSSPGTTGQVLTNSGGVFVPATPAPPVSVAGTQHVVTGSRFAGTSYVNNYGSLIFISGHFHTTGSSVGNISVTVNGVTVYANQATATITSGDAGFFAAVPAGATYQVNISGAVSGSAIDWVETTVI